MSFSMMICPNCQGEMRMYFDPNGYDANCPNCGYHVGNLLVTDDSSTPLANPTTVLVRFAVQTTSRIYYRRNGGRKIHMPEGPRDYIVLDREIEVPIPDGRNGSRKDSMDFVFDFTWEFEKYLKRNGIRAYTFSSLNRLGLGEVSEHTYVVSHESDVELKAGESDEPLTVDEAEALFDKANAWIESEYKSN